MFKSIQMQIRSKRLPVRSFLTEQRYLLYPIKPLKMPFLPPFEEQAQLQTW